MLSIARPAHRVQLVYLLRAMSDVETGAATQLFAGEIDPEERGRLEEQYGRRFGVGETLLEEGAPARHVLLLQEGRVRLVRRVANAERGLTILTRGDLFGEGALRNVPAHAFTAVALTDGSLLALDREGFHAFVESHPRAAIPLIERLLYRLRDAEDQVEIMMMSGPETRVTSALLKLANSLAGAAEVAISPVELSTYVGLGIDAVKRIVDSLCERRYLRVRRERIEIVDIEALRRLNLLLGTKDNLARRDA
jgi:CRP/FNR family cyclic AMP-dependent transcriptional regulator